MDFGQVEAFVQVATHRSFSRAAKALQLTQPSITARIQSLERDLGEEVFDRGGRGVRLTDAGQAFLPYAQKILQTLQEGRDSVDEVRTVQLGSLRLGCAPTMSIYVLPKILQAYYQRYPSVAVFIRTGRSEQVLTMLLNEEVQVGLVRSLYHPEIETVHLYDDQIVLVAPAHHSFAKAEKVIMEDVAAQPLILFDRGSSYFGLIHSLFRQAELIPTVAMELDSLEATKYMVEEGLGIALVPRVTIKREVQMGSLVEVEIIDAPPVRRSIALIYRKNRKRQRSAMAFVDMLKEIYCLEDAKA